jgi:starch synthase (maltosyl-transferring)
VGDRRGAARASRRDLSGRGVHAAEGDAPAREVGFTQSYTYFTWRNTKQELTAYFTELAQGPGREYFRPNAWPNTPDILNEYLHGGQRAAFMARLVLAATLAANYGIYGPAFELLEGEAARAGQRGIPRLREVPAAPPRPRAQRQPRPLHRPHQPHPPRQPGPAGRPQPALLDIDNDQLIAYVKRADSGEDDGAENVVLCVVNLDPHHVQSGWIALDAAGLGVESGQPFQMHDQLANQRFVWQGARRFVRLDPARSPAHVFVLRRRVRSERDFDYFL